MEYSVLDPGLMPERWKAGCSRDRCLASTTSLNKLKTYEWMRECTNLRTPTTYYGDDPVLSWGPYSLLSKHETHSAHELVIKPIMGSCGAGVRALAFDFDTLRWQDTLGRFWTTTELSKVLQDEYAQRKLKGGWFTEELVKPHASQRGLLELPRTVLVLRYWFHAGTFLGGVWMAPHRKSDGQVTFLKGVRWGWFNYNGIMTPVYDQNHILSNDCKVNGEDFTGFEIEGAGGAIVDALEKVAVIWKPAGTLRIDGFVNQDREWVFGEIETNQRAPTNSGCPRHMKNLKGLGRP